MKKESVIEKKMSRDLWENDEDRGGRHTRRQESYDTNNNSSPSMTPAE
jgi:hypothetical protein